jgi:predicted GNAT family acetyltransferase
VNEINKNPEGEPEVEIIEGFDVGQYLDPVLKREFVSLLVTANRGGIFDEKYFSDYFGIFEERVKEGEIILLLCEGKPVSIVGLCPVGSFSPDGRVLFEMCNFVTLPAFEGRGFATLLMKHVLNKIRAKTPDCSMVATTRSEKIARKCIQFGMREDPGSMKIRVLCPREKYQDMTDQEYEEYILEHVAHMRQVGFMDFFLIP